MKLYQLDTPALILDKAVFDQNRRTMQQLMARTNMQFRPHYKSHRCPAIALMQLQDGAKGITCAKLGEAEDLAAAGVQDILIANQIVQPEKLPRVAALASRCRLTLCVDDAKNILALEAAMAEAETVLHCLVEYEVGMSRCGVETHQEVLKLAELIQQQPHLRFEGIQAYAGQMSHEMDPTVRSAVTEQIEADLCLLKKALENAGLPVKEISGGSTGMIELKPQTSIYTEMQCGSYLFMDQGDPVFAGFESYPVRMSEEHAQIAVPGHSCKINDKIRLIPGHCCTTINVHDHLYVVDGEDVIDRWAIISRGKSW